MHAPMTRPIRPDFRGPSQSRSAAKAAPKVRSLHYIDDEDYESLPERAGNDAKKTPDNMDLPEI